MRSSRTWFAFVLILVLMGSVTALPAAAQDTATNPFADLGLPEVAITVTDAAIEGAPAELTAGRYVLAVTNQATVNDPATQTSGVGFLQPPDGMTAADFIAFVADMAAGPPAAASPMVDASPMASPADAAMAGPPPWYYEALLAGGIYAEAGATAYTVLDLTAGEWVLWTENPTAPQPPVAIMVTGDAPADQPTPAADVTITMAEMTFTLDQPLASGPQIIALTNAGQQPHFLGMAGVPDGTTIDDVLHLSMMYMDPMATPSATLSFEDFQPVVDTADLSSGMTNWVSVDLTPGSYLLVCFVPDQETGVPHAMLGMIDIVPVP